MKSTIHEVAHEIALELPNKLEVKVDERSDSILVVDGDLGFNITRAYILDHPIECVKKVAKDMAAVLVKMPRGEDFARIVPTRELIGRDEYHWPVFRR